jgi:hypothetical protein
MDVSRDTRDGETHSSSAQYGVTASAGGGLLRLLKPLRRQPAVQKTAMIHD